MRRELLRARKSASVLRLDALGSLCEYLPISTVAMRRAAELWAMARQTGQPTAVDNTIDADIILVAQGQSLGVSHIEIATTNVGHLSRFMAAHHWRQVVP